MSKNGNSDIGAALSTVPEKEAPIHTLSTGIRVRLLPVNQMLVQTAMNRIKDPPVPIVIDEQQGREYSNPTDPIYLTQIAEANVQRGYARMNTVILWGVELVDGLPDNDDWLYKLQFQERQGDLDLSDFDFNNPVDKEFAYKKFIAIGNAVDKNGLNTDISLILNRGVVSEEAIEDASGNFQGEAERDADQDSTPEKSEVVSG